MYLITDKEGSLINFFDCFKCFRYSTTGSNYDVEGLAIELLSAEENVEGSPGAPLPDNTGCSPPFKKNYPSDEPWLVTICVKRG